MARVRSVRRGPKAGDHGKNFGLHSRCDRKPLVSFKWEQLRSREEVRSGGQLVAQSSVVKGVRGQRPWFLLPCVSSLYTRHISASCPKWRWLSQRVRMACYSPSPLLWKQIPGSLACSCQWHPLAEVLPQSLLGRR